MESKLENNKVTMENTIKDYIQTNKNRFLDELFELLRISSVSADPNYKNEVFVLYGNKKASHFLNRRLKW